LGIVASGMDNNSPLGFTEEEYMVLARQKYTELNALKSKPTFYDYEKSFEEIWFDLGRQVLEKSLSQVPGDRRKKKA
jgi:hypothetical protein